MSIRFIPTSDVVKIVKLFSRKIGLFFLAVAGLYLDSAVLAEKFEYNQLVRINAFSALNNAME